MTPPVNRSGRARAALRCALVALGCLAGAARAQVTSAVVRPPPAPFFAPGQLIRIFVLTGQSNSLGTTADKNERDITPGQDPRDKEIPFFYANRSTRAKDGPAAVYGDSGGRIVSLCVQQGQGANPCFWGPEIGFARGLARAGVKNFLMVKASRGGGGNSYWLKGSRDDHMYRHVVDTVAQAVKALPDGARFEIAALLYVQGESDNASEAAAAGERLQLLAANLRRDLPNATAMQVLIGGVANGGKSGDTVRARQSGLPQIDPTFHYVDTMDLRSQRYDNLHFSKGAKLELGRRLAALWLSGENSSRRGHTAKP